MNPVLAAGLLIGVLCAVWTFIMGATGWYKDPAMMRWFFLVIAIEVGGLIWGLRRTAAEGRTYGGQVIAGTMMATIAGVVIICASLLFTTVVYTDYFAELEAMNVKILRERGVPESEIDRQVIANRASDTPMGHALLGFTGALIVGIIASALLSIAIRGRQRTHP